jgi:hypothetical protein
MAVDILTAVTRGVTRAAEIMVAVTVAGVVVIINHQ